MAPIPWLSPMRVKGKAALSSRSLRTLISGSSPRGAGAGSAVLLLEDGSVVQPSRCSGVADGTRGRAADVRPHLRPKAHHRSLERHPWSRPHTHNMAAQDGARADTRLGKGSPISIDRMSPEQTNDGTTTSKFGLSMDHARRCSLEGRVVFGLVLRRWSARSVQFVASAQDRPVRSFRRTANEHKVLFAP